MSWFKIDDGLHGHPKARAAGLAAMGLWAVAGAYSAAYNLEGHVPDHYVRSWPNGTKLAGILVQVGLWHRGTDACPCLRADHEPTGWWYHDWLDRNPAADKVTADRKAAAGRQRISREKRRDASGRLAGTA